MSMADLYDRRLQEIRELRELNEELLEALRALRHRFPLVNHEVLRQADEAIAKAEKLK